MSASLWADDTPAPTAPASSPDALPVASASPKPAKLDKKGQPKQPKPPKAVVSKEIPIPLPVGESALGTKIPNYDTITGKLLSNLMAIKMTRLDANHMQMQGTKIDLNQADGKSDYHIDIPTSVFNTETHIITSDQPVVIKTEDFELTGERMTFNTLERSGEFSGKVHMIIHNLKQTAGFTPQQSPKPE